MPVAMATVTVMAAALGPMASAAAGPALTREDLAAWLDGYVPQALQQGRIAGAVVMVVKDGAVLSEKAYGYADVDAGRPLDAETSMLRPGSVSKLMTWTAIMQLVEQGKLNLDGDINAYLDFRIPPFNGQPVTLRNLMTHTPGFAAAYTDMIRPYPAPVPALGAYLKAELPERIYAPGDVTAYSNYGAALAGYIVERVSGVAFEDYIARFVFQPLHMAHSTFSQPLPARWQANMARGYRMAGEPGQAEEMIIAPAGGAAVTGADMAKFMLAHLQDGQYQGQRILEARSAQLMHNSRHTTVSTELNRMLLGFYEFDRNGHRIIGHDGDSHWFHSRLQLYLDDHVGLFISLNSQGLDGAARALRQGLTAAFSDRYFPATPVPRAALAAPSEVTSIAGRYYSSVSEPDSFLSLINLFDQTLVTNDREGRVRVSSITGPDGVPKLYEPVAPRQWREVGGQDRLSAKLVDGKVTMLGSDTDPTFNLLAVPPAMDASWLLPSLAMALLAQLLYAALGPLGALARWHYGIQRTPSAKMDVTTRRARLGAAASASVMIGWLATVAYMAANLAMSSALRPWLLILHLLSDCVFPLAFMLALWYAGRPAAWRRTHRSALTWVSSIAMVAASGVTLWTALAFHLIGLGVHF
jgi:CubicO group peptidase (beta-lactamase class C family)